MAKNGNKNGKNGAPKMGKPPHLRVVGFPDERGKRQKPSEFGPAERAYFRELHRLVDLIYDEAAEYQWTWNQLAEEAGLAYQTVERLGDRKTRWPRFSTVWRLAKAVGFDLAIKNTPKAKQTPVLAKLA